MLPIDDVIVYFLINFQKKKRSIVIIIEENNKRTWITDILSRYTIVYCSDSTRVPCTLSIV